MILETAAKRIEEALENENTQLDLNGLGLNTLPSNFADIAAGLRTLNLEGNKFQSVPREIALCVNLEVLYLAQNELVTGYGLAALRKLTTLF